MWVATALRATVVFLASSWAETHLQAPPSRLHIRRHLDARPSVDLDALDAQARAPAVIETLAADQDAEDDSALRDAADATDAADAAAAGFSEEAAEGEAEQAVPRRKRAQMRHSKAVRALADALSGPAAGRSQGFMAARSRGVGEGMRCYVNDEFPVPENTEACAGDQNACLIRVVQDLTTGATDTTRYCSSAQLCAGVQINEWHQVDDPAGRTYIRCCNTEGCNSGIPAPITNGYYWIRPYASDVEFLTYDPESPFRNMRTFENNARQKWYVNRTVAKHGSSKFHLIPAELVTTGWATPVDAYHPYADMIFEILETDLLGYTVLETSSPTPQPLVSGLSDATAKFSFTSTLPDWNVGSVGRHCPSRQAVPTASTLLECYEACVADARCSHIGMLEWDTAASVCHMVVGACPDAELVAGSEYLYRYQSPCAAVTCPESACQFAGTCDTRTGTCSAGAFRPAGEACDDLDAGTVDDVCAGNSATCAGRDRCLDVECLAPTCQSVVAGLIDEMHLLNGCNRETGQCRFVSQADGTLCDDGDDRTVDDRCVAGSCQGTATDLCANIECVPQSSCHEVGVCQWQDGSCPQTLKVDHSECDDGDESTFDDECIAGVCTGKVDKCAGISCQSTSSCHEVGVCDRETGQCSHAFTPADTPCDDKNDQTGEDKCNGEGVCLGRDLCEDMECPAQGECEAEGHCNPGTGECSIIMKTDHTPCGDQQEGQCLSGICEIAEEALDLCIGVSCPYGDQCHGTSKCNPEDGTCSLQEVLVGESCDDGIDATVQDVCSAEGACVGKRSVQQAFE